MSESRGIAETVRAILAQRATPGALNGDDVGATPLHALGIDSAETVNVVIELEQTFQLEIPDAELHRLRTVGDIVRAITAALDDGASR